MKSIFALTFSFVLLVNQYTIAFPIEASQIRLEQLLSSEPNLDAQLRRLDMLADSSLRFRRAAPDLRCKGGECIVPRSIRQILPFV
ncbi:unnamed protein product [Bursaphelenchus okinawaensis]|uniref:Uncharacterized protein n=1 Tax=Bursaphelenchus okinawaensis TaxID=465554 RepID=A0A811LP72_9BILA|nr:unnamed protein product [Bursaphelenchus okinawaensis]CAG9124820.1 unnamed protein product [Bursaphelenchus okinawaensis]